MKVIWMIKNGWIKRIIIKFTFMKDKLVVQKKIEQNSLEFKVNMLSAFEV